MIYYGSKYRAGSFRTVRKNTIVIAEDIPEQHYGFRAAPETRTVGQMLVHIALMPRLGEQIHLIERRTPLEGFDFFGLMGALRTEEQVARPKGEIRGILRAQGARLTQC